MSSAADPAIGTVSMTLDVDITRRDCRAVWVGGAGDLSVVMSAGDTAVFAGIAAGTLLPIRVKKINSSGTTASSIVVLY